MFRNVFFASLAFASLPLAAHAQSVGYVTSLTASGVDPANKVPTLNAVPGSGITNLDVGFPVSIIPHGANVVVSLTAQNGTYGGTCQSSYKITQKQGTKTVTLLSSVIKKSYACGTGTYWFWVIETPGVPNSVGPATLTGTVKFGTTAVSLSEPIYIQ